MGKHVQTNFVSGDLSLIYRKSQIIVRKMMHKSFGTKYLTVGRNWVGS